MIIKNISVFNTSRKCFEISDVEIRDNKFYNIGKINTKTKCDVDGSGRYLLPGLIDIHMHIESSMTTPVEFSNTVLKMGTTTIVADAHEVANSLGYEGLLEYMDTKQYLDIFYAIPSSVPSTNPKLETTRGVFTEREVSLICKHPKIRALGEIMNFAEIVCEGDSQTKRIIKAFRDNHKLYPIEGHVPLVTGEELSKYLLAGIGSDHTHQSVESLIEKTRAGFQIQLQEKSMTKEIFDAILNCKLEESICIVTDDVMPDDLISKGHLNHLIKKSVSLGYPIEKAIYAATKTPADRMLLFDRGVIAPGKIADAIILSDLDNFVIDDVIKNGVLVSTLSKEPQPKFDSKYLSSIQRKITKTEDFVIKQDGSQVLVRVIERELKSTFTHEREVLLDVVDGKLDWKSKGLNLLCVLERYGNNSPIAFGFVKNGFSENFAMATSWSHDNHNILVMGTDENLISKAVNQVISNQGGMACESSDSRAFLPLEFGGVVSLDSMENISEKVKTIRSMMKNAGYKSHNEILSFSVLSLLCTPHLKLSDKGYVRVRTGEILPWKIKAT